MEHQSLEQAKAGAGARPFRVFSFEASPYIAPFVEAVTAHRNASYSRQTEPKLPFPTAGSSKDIGRINDESGRPCPAEVNELRKCFLGIYRSDLDQVKPSVHLNSSELIAERLAIARENGKFQRVPKYVFIPAAVGVRDSWLAINQSKLGLLIGGTTTKGREADFTRFGDEEFPSTIVRTIDIVTWLKKYFHRDDLVVVKMDIEGAEHDVANSLVKSGVHELIDVLAWECHYKGGNCKELRNMLRNSTDIILLEEGRDYNGW